MAKSNTVNYILVGMVALIVVLSIFQSFQIRALKDKQVTNVASSGGTLDVSDWTDEEKMMYEHHGTMPARLGGQQTSSGGMVGGC